MQYLETQPSASTRSVVRCFWQLQGAGVAEANADPALPDGSPELIFNIGDPFEQVEPNGQAVTQPQAFLVGQITRPLLVRPTGRTDLIAVRFEAHGAALLHDDVAALTDRWVGINSLRGGVLLPVVDRLQNNESLPARLVVLEGAIAQLMQSSPGADGRVVSAVATIRQTHGNLRCDDLAETLGLTPRSLQRLFARQVGISPKLLARIVRFQRVFAARRDDPGSFARVAAQCGYSDQSHLVRDFRDFAGMPPAELLAAVPALTGFWLT